MQATTLKALLDQNDAYSKHYRNTDLIQLVTGQALQDKTKRDRLLDCIQIFSNYFQKTVMLRNVFCDNPKFISVTQKHLEEEFGHNIELMQDRNYRAPLWDPVLEATSAWFAWKMLTLDSEEKTVLIHLVLETSANIFFQKAHQALKEYNETDYFAIHSTLDEEHEKIGIELLQNLSAEKYKNLFAVQEQGWRILNTVSDQIAKLTTS